MERSTGCISRQPGILQRQGKDLRKTEKSIVRTIKFVRLFMYLAIFMSLRYIENYTYRMELSPWIFILTALITLVISVAAVFGQILSAAKVNPTEVLKKE